ncbi:hypothetical protein ACE6ED_16085 [Paenibacillus sp. CN-4]|uniref:hypothetical protein n=1 Tax=Paenibacillus nanchangensis TaxID=3348343 RepID=UPI003979BCAA
MKKTEWLIAVVFIGMGLTCLTISAFSFPAQLEVHAGGFAKMAGCLAVLGLLTVLFVRFRKARKKR